MVQNEPSREHTQNCTSGGASLPHPATRRIRKTKVCSPGRPKARLGLSWPLISERHRPPPVEGYSDGYLAVACNFSASFFHAIFANFLPIRSETVRHISLFLHTLGVAGPGMAQEFFLVWHTFFFTVLSKDQNSYCKMKGCTRTGGQGEKIGKNSPKYGK